jgi:hypothetical protein
MVASAANGFQNTDPNTCAGSNFSFHPEYSTARFGNFVPWAALQFNINIAVEIGHFTPGINGDGDADDPPCFPGPTVAGCLNLAEGGDIDFDGTSYRFDWPDGTEHTATSLLVTNPEGGLGPLSSERRRMRGAAGGCTVLSLLFGPTRRTGVAAVGWTGVRAAVR